MTWWEAIILGIIEGLTEYLPVSSTGHLLVTQRLLGIPNDDAANAYAICIQGGAILAVLGLYFGRVKQGLRGFTGDPEGLRLLKNLMAGFFPAAVIGLIFNDLIKEHLFGVWPIIFAWFVGGLIILAVSYRRKGKGKSEGFGLEQLTWQLALIIGFAQCIAMWPGVSRSLITIVAGVLVGMRLAAAVEFSFLLGVITLGAATVYDALKHGDKMLEVYGPIEMIIGFVAAFFSAVLAVKWMVAYLNKHGMAIFGWYRVGIAIVIAALVITNVMTF